MKLPDWLMLAVWRSLAGEIYPSIRAIALELSDEPSLLIRYYLDRDPTEMDEESIETVATNISAMVPLQNIQRIDVECIKSSEPVGRLDCLDGFIYTRREYEL